MKNQFKVNIGLALTVIVPLVTAVNADDCRLSNVFGNNMVLQRDDVATQVWGFAASQTLVHTTFGNEVLNTVANKDGIWKQVLPSTPANDKPQTISFACSSGEKFTLNNVLFGDVHICGGQSNMQFTVDCIGQQLGFDANAEIQKANGYPNVRTMTVGQTWTSLSPLNELYNPPTLTWSVASNTSIGAGNWSATSAVCWFYGKDLYDATGVPVGLISSNWGGTIIQSWSDNETNAKCSHMAHENLVLPLGVDIPEAFVSSNINAPEYPNPNTGYGVLFNAMINPFAVGPMSVKSFIWFQGESNLGQGGSFYACAQTAMIKMWRSYFQKPDAFFGFVELEPWIGAGTNLADFRQFQLASLVLKNVGYAIGTDIGDPTGPFTSIHPRNKKVIGKRLAAAALTLAYGKPTTYLPPVYKSSTTHAAKTHHLAQSGTNLSITISFDDLPSKFVYASDYCKTELKVPVSDCAWFSIIGSDGVALNASATIGSDGTTLVLKAFTNASNITPISSNFGWNAWPINMIMTAEGLPLQPWINESVTIE
jgi:sialate O-acetylesterase